MTLPTDKSEAETLALQIAALCSGHQVTVLVMVLSKLLGDVIASSVPSVTDGRQWRKELKRRWLEAVAAAFEEKEASR